MSTNGEQPRTANILATVSHQRKCQGCDARIVFAQRVGSGPSTLTPFRAPFEVLARRGTSLVIGDTNHFTKLPAAYGFYR
jgi:hypothetical protein